MIFLLDAKDFVNTMKKIAKETITAESPSDFVFGTVISEQPLKIKIEQKITLTEEQLILCRNVTDFQTKMSFDNEAIQQPIEVDNSVVVDTLITPSGVTNPVTLKKDGISGIVGKLRNVEKVKHEITVYNALKVGEKVALIQEQGGQRYLVVDRVVAL